MFAPMCIMINSHVRLPHKFICCFCFCLYIFLNKDSAYSKLESTFNAKKNKQPAKFGINKLRL